MYVATLMKQSKNSPSKTHTLLKTEKMKTLARQLLRATQREDMTLNTMSYTIINLINSFYQAYV